VKYDKQTTDDGPRYGKMGSYKRNVSAKTF